MSNPINNDVDSLPYVLAVSGASAQQLAERSLELLLENGRHVHLILSRGAHEVWSAELDVHVPVEPEACLLYTSPSPRDKRQSRMPSSA